MQTRCPHCRTVYSIEDHLVEELDARVRCGECMTLFNARDCLLADVRDDEAALPDLSTAATDAHGDGRDGKLGQAVDELEATHLMESSELPEPGDVFEVADDEVDEGSAAVDPASSWDDADATDVADMTAQIEWPELQLPDLGFQADGAFDQTAPPHSATPLAMGEPLMATGTGEALEADSPAERSLEEDEQAILDVLEAAPSIASAMPEAVPVEDFPAAPASLLTDDVSLVDASEQPDPAPITALEDEAEAIASPVAPASHSTDAFTEKGEREAVNEVPLPHLMREELAQHDAQETRRGSRKPWVWTLGALLLLLIISTQLMFWQRDNLAANPTTRELAERLCRVFNCALSPLRDVQHIELLQRSVYSHPNVSGALIISVSMVNNASYDQPYPTLAIRMADVRGRAVAARNFRPVDYLQVGTEPADMPAGLPVTVTLEVFDPGRDALTFELDFL